MPLMSISGEQAFANVRSSRASLWPDGRRDHVRLSGVAKVTFQPSFQLSPGEMIFTAGSCFARNIEKRFAQLGFEMPACALSLPAEERASETDNDFLNKYPPQSILNEFRWALDPAAAYPETGFLQLGPDQWHDAHSAPNLKPASIERVRERRAMVLGLYRQIPACRVVVITLGLIEAWFDEETGHYLNGAPPAVAAQAQPSRFRLDVLTVDEVCDTLEQIHDLLARFGHPDFRLLLTVSPVPLRNTFTGKDAITANSYSKSVLRAATEVFVHGHPRVDYFPSYEIVTHTLQSSAFIQDNRHVTPQVVNVIVDRVVKAYCPALDKIGDERPIAPPRAPRAIRTAIRTRDYARAAELYGALELKRRYELAGYDEFSYRLDYGRILLRGGAIAEAQTQLARAVHLAPASAAATHQLARALARLQRPLEAEEHFRRAAELAPDSSEFRLALSNQLCELGKFNEAEREILGLLDRDPSNAQIISALETLRTRKAAEAPGTLAHP